MTPSEAGSPVDGTSTPKKQEPFEKSLVLNEITVWIEEHKDYLLRDHPDVLVPSEIDFGNVNPKAESVRKMIRVENQGSRIVQIQPLKIIPNPFDQLVCHNKDTIYAHPANGTEPMFGVIDITLTTGGKDPCSVHTNALLQGSRKLGLTSCPFIQAISAFSQAGS
jgi:hypothetical protein